MKTTKVIPIDVGDVHMVITIDTTAPDSVVPATAKNTGKRMPENIRDEIERRLMLGEKPSRMAQEMAISPQIIYIMRARMYRDGVLEKPRRSLLDEDPIPMHTSEDDSEEEVPAAIVEELDEIPL